MSKEEIKPILPPGFRIFGPIYETIMTSSGDVLTCERWQGERRRCKVNDAPVPEIVYRDRLHPQKRRPRTRRPKRVVA